jgi:replication-associated recombination protein RarA
MRIGLTEKYKPARLKDFAGLKRARAIMGKLVSDPWESAWLLTGSSGTGKSTMAMAVAKELGAEVHHVPSSRCTKEAVEQLVYDCNFMPMSGSGWHACIVEEADMMTVQAQTAFLSVLDGSGRFPDKTVFFFTSNSTKKLEDRFLARCRVIEFDGGVDAAELGQFLYDVWFAEAPAHATSPLMHKVIAETKGNVRAALMAVEMELLMIPDAPKKASVFPRMGQAVTA